MGDIALRGNRLTFAKGGRAGFQSGKRVGHKRTGNTQRENRLEELGRVDAERAWTRHGKRDLRLEKHRIRDELKHGGKPWGTGPKPGTHEFLEHHLHKPRKKKAVGGAVKIGKKFLKFIKTGKDEMTPGVKINVPKAAERLTGKPHVDHGKRKRIKHLGRGKAEGGRIGRAAGGWTKVLPTGPRGGHPGFTKESMHERWGGGEKGKPHSSKEGRIAAGKRNMRRQRKRSMEAIKKWRDSRPKTGPQAPSRPAPKFGPGPRDPSRPAPKFGPGPRDPGKPKGWQAVATGGRIGLKKGGSDKNWIQKAVNPKHKGFCTPMTKKTCTPRRKALARTFKKMGRERKAKG